MIKIKLLGQAWPVHKPRRPLVAGHGGEADDCAAVTCQRACKHVVRPVVYRAEAHLLASRPHQVHLEVVELPLDPPDALRADGDPLVAFTQQHQLGTPRTAAVTTCLVLSTSESLHYFQIN